MVVVVFTMIFSCKKSKKEDEQSLPSTKVEVTDSKFSNIGTKAKLLWTAYKFTDKVAVSGTFDQFELTTIENTSTPENLLVGNKIMINTHSVNTENPIRDAKIRIHFFDVMETDTILGEIISAKNGKGKLMLELHQMKDTVSYTYMNQLDTLVVNTAIDLNNWNGQKAINSLNTECYELHMGPDKISKLWPDINIILKIPL
jgi:hypothetical protein